MADAGVTHAAWSESVPDLVVARSQEWDLRVGEAYEAGAAGYAVRVELRDGTPAVLKLVFPHRESEHEADALALWNGDGAVRLFARSEDGCSLLLERCEPGIPLSGAGPEAALDALIELLPRLSKPASQPFRLLSDESAWWSSHLIQWWEEFGKPFERRLLDAAVDALTELPPTQRECVLVHQDLHAENVLAAQREPWLATDPKPLLGEREFSVAPIVRAFELGHDRASVLRRLDRLTSELGLDRERARGWTIGQTIAWSFDSTFQETHVDTARWFLDAAR